MVDAHDYTERERNDEKILIKLIAIFVPTFHQINIETYPLMIKYNTKSVRKIICEEEYYDP